MRLVLVLVLIVLQHTAPGKCRATILLRPRAPTTSPAPSPSPVAKPVTPPAHTTTAAPSTEPELNIVQKRNHELSALLLPLVEADHSSSYNEWPKHPKKQIVKIRPLHPHHSGKDQSVALILTSDIPKLSKTKKLHAHVILDSHGIRQNKKYNNKHNSKHFIYKSDPSDENYSDEELDNSVYDTGEDFSNEDNSSSDRSDEVQYSNEDQDYKRKKYTNNRKHYHGFANIPDHDYSSKQFSRDENGHTKSKHSKSLNYYHVSSHAVSNGLPSSIDNKKLQRPNKNPYDFVESWSESDSGSDEPISNESNQGKFVHIGTNNIHKYKDVSNKADESNINSDEYSTKDTSDEESNHKSKVLFKLINKSLFESNEPHSNEDSVEETVQNIAHSNKHKNSKELNEFSVGDYQGKIETPNSDETQKEIDHNFSETQNIFSGESSSLESQEKVLSILNNQHLISKDLFAQHSNDELQESLENAYKVWKALNKNKSSVSTEKLPTEDSYESLDHEKVDSVSGEDSESIEDYNTSGEGIKFLNLVSDHDIEGADTDHNNYHAIHFYDSNDQHSSNEDPVSYDDSNTGEYLDDQTDYRDETNENVSSSSSAELTHEHSGDIQNGCENNEFIKQILEQQSSLDLSKKIILQDLSGEDKSIEGVIEVIGNTPHHFHAQSYEDDGVKEDLKHKAAFNKGADCHKEAHKTYKLSFRFNR